MKPNLPALAMVIFLPLLLSGQSRWMRTYFDGQSTHSVDIIVSYDGGYLLSGWTIGSSFDWLIKTDINGEVLWEKRIGEYVYGTEMFGMSQNNQGEIYLAGETHGFGSDSDPIIIKLNPCGEKEWCRVIATASDYDYAVDVCALDQGGCTVSLRNSTTNWDFDRVCLLNLDKDGNYRWKECYNGLDTNVFVLDHEDLLLTSEGGYLISGDCNYYDTVPPYYQRSLAYLVKTDSLGQFQWELPVEKEPSSQNRGNAYHATMSPDGQYYYASIRHYIRGEVYGDSPALVKVDLAGNELGIYDLAPPDSYGTLYESMFLNDSTLAAIAIWGDNYTNYKLILTSPEGEIRQEKSFLEGSYEGFLRITHDNKILVFTDRYDDVNLSNAYLIKFNNQLIDDTLYLQPMRYDTLCPYSVLSDTILTDDCGLIVDIEEKPAYQLLQTDNIRAWPNPCRDYITISFNDDDKPGRVDFYSVYGQHLYSKNIERKQNQLTINTENFPPGIIIAVLRNSDNKTLVTKIIKL